MPSTAASTSSDDSDDDSACYARYVRPIPHNTTEESIVSATAAHVTVEMTQKQPRLRWKSVLGVKNTNKDGSPHTHSYPFLSDKTNWMDIMFARHLIVDRPFDAPHGKLGSAWTTTAHYVSKAVDPDGNLVFPLGCNARQAKTRFQELMAVMKKMENEVPFKSGCDDEEDRSELHLLLEELLELSTSAASSNATATKSTNAVSAATKAQDRKNADVLRRASVGLVSAEELRELRSGKKRKATPNCVSPQPTNEIMAFNKAIEERSKQRKIVKDLERKEKYALKARRYEIEQEREARRLEMDREREERQFRVQEQNMQLQAQLLRNLEQQSKKNDE